MGILGATRCTYFSLFSLFPPGSYFSMGILVTSCLFYHLAFSIAVNFTSFIVYHLDSVTSTLFLLFLPLKDGNK